MIFNINDWVYVRLTQRGRDILKQQHEQLCRDIPAYKRPFVEPTVDADGYTRFQMHDLMHRFGAYIALGLEVPFDTNIKIRDGDLKPQE